MVVAARDEAERIGATLAALARAFPGAPVWVADDGSADATGEIAVAAGAHVVRSERTLGKGEAMTLAARAALASWHERASGERAGGERAGGERTGGEGAGGGRAQAAVFVLCDGDLGESAAQLSALAQLVAGGQADVAVAAFARRLGGGFGLALRFARWAIRRRCGLRADAPVSGQRALSAGALADVLPFAHGFGMEIGITIDAVRAGHRVVELELDLHHRASGRTPAGFAHRARQLADFARVYRARRVTLRPRGGTALR